MIASMLKLLLEQEVQAVEKIREANQKKDRSKVLKR